MRYFYDCEFIEDGRTIDLVSIGVVAEDGREYYAVSTEFDPTRAGAWVRSHVLDKLPSPASQAYRSRRAIREDLSRFLLAGGDPRTAGPGAIELWAWVGAYDHVVLCQLWGDMTALPKYMPRFTRDVKQLWEARGRPWIPPVPAGAHDALVDARHDLAKFRAIEDANAHPGAAGG